MPDFPIMLPGRCRAALRAHSLGQDWSAFAYMRPSTAPTPRAWTTEYREFTQLSVVSGRLPMLGVIVPAHNEEEHIGACLVSVKIATQCPRLNGEPVLIVVALDACTDKTEAIARSMGPAVVCVGARNVGIARASGALYALNAGVRWLAFTDADSVVGPEWLSAQLAQRSDAVCGTIEVRDWGDYGERLRLHHEALYSDADGHRHIHGANFGITAVAYREVGGFPPLACSEDVALVEALRRRGASIAWSAAPRVVTSARRRYRAPGGFGETLARLHHEGAGSRAVPEGIE